jgi:hypothetical protein
MIRTIGAAIGVLVIVFFMSDIASRLGSAPTPSSPGPETVDQPHL